MERLVILLIMDVEQQSRRDPQFVEILGRHYLITELMRAGIEVAEPVRDRGVDLVVSPGIKQPRFPRF